MTEPTTTLKRRRPRGEGSIYQVSGGRWRAAIVTVDPDTGARTRRVVSGTTFEQTRDRMADLRRDIEQGVRAGKPKTIDAFVGPWLAALKGRVRPSTWRSHEQYLRLYIRPALGRLRLSGLTPTHVERMTAGMVDRGLSGTTARGARTTLRLLLRDAQRDGAVARNVAALARPPRQTRPEMHVLTADETRRFLEATADDEYGPLFALAALTGLRQGEVLGLAWGDVADLDGPTPTLTVRRALARMAGGWGLSEPKTARSRRTLELGATAARALRRQRSRWRAAKIAAGDLWQDRDGLVFTDALGRALKGTEVTRAFSAALARLKLPHVRFHDLRHGVASMLLAQGVPLKLVSEQLGHSTITITADVYAHVSREQRREAASAIERALGGE